MEMPSAITAFDDPGKIRFEGSRPVLSDRAFIPQKQLGADRTRLKCQIMHFSALVRWVFRSQEK